MVLVVVPGIYLPRHGLSTLLMTSFSESSRYLGYTLLVFGVIDMENEVDTINLPRTLDLVYWLVSLVPVIILLAWDLWKAWDRWAPWIPGQVPVLRPLIFHLLSFIDYSRISVYSGSRYQTKEVVAILVKDQLAIDSGRLMLCVLIAYLIPGMAGSGSIMDGNSLAAFAFSIAYHAVSELRSDWKVEKRNESLSAPLAASSEGLDRKNSHLNHYIVAIILIFAITYLVLRLIYAFVIGRTIRRFMSQNVPSAISCGTPNGEWGYDDTKHHVLKCWIVVRVCQPDYVLYRSSLCSKLWPIVTSCFGCYIINWIYIYIYIMRHKIVIEGTLVESVIAGQIVLVGIGWIVLFVRWVTSDGQVYFDGILQDLKSELKVGFIRFIGFIGFIDRRIQERRIREISWYPQNNTTRHSESVLKAGVSYDNFYNYIDTLKTLLFRGEIATTLWRANQRGFRRVQSRMEQGIKDGEGSSSKLIRLLTTGTPEDREKAERLRQANKNSWKRTAVSLIRFMIYFYDGSDASVIEDAMQCYIQGWEYMDFVDGLDEEVKSLGRQADGEFDILEHSWNKLAQHGMLETGIRQPLRELRARLDRLPNEERRKLQNSWNSTEVAEYCLFETGTVIDTEINQETGRVIDPEINQIHRLQRVLAKVYFFYMTEAVNKAVLQKCSKLAEEGMEEEILDVAFLSAKAQGVLDKYKLINVGGGNDPVELTHNTENEPDAGEHDSTDSDKKDDSTDNGPNGLNEPRQRENPLLTPINTARKL